MKLPEKLTKLKAYDPISGSCAVRLDSNESYFDLPSVFKAKLLGILEQIDCNRYPDPLAAQTVEAFAAYYHLSPDCVTAGNGSDEIITLLLNCFLSRGDKLVTLTPDFSMYGIYASLAELEVTALPKQENRQISVPALIEACKGANALIFSNPCNPTSLGIPRADVVRILEGVPDCLVIVDEAYMDFWDESVLDLVEKYDNLVVLRTCSKAIGMAAARMGFAVMDPYKTRLLRACKSPYNCDAFSQALCAAVLRETELLERCRDEIIVQTQRLYTGIGDLASQHPDILETVYATRTNFVFVKTAYAKEIHESLLRAGIAVRCFPDGLRVCAGTRREQMLLLSQLEQILSPD